MATVRLPRLLDGSLRGDLRQDVEGDTLAQALESLFLAEPGVRNHILDEEGEIRPHILVFVNGTRAHLDTDVTAEAEIQVLQAVSGG
jgi:sulfur-carrier protein